LPTLQGLLPANVMGDEQALQHDTVARRLERRDMERHCLKTAAGAGTKRKRAGALGQGAQPRPLSIENLDASNVPVSIRVKLDLFAGPATTSTAAMLAATNLNAFIGIASPAGADAHLANRNFRQKPGMPASSPLPHEAPATFHKPYARKTIVSPQCDEAAKWRRLQTGI
jgi:hypothetical protein